MGTDEKDRQLICMTEITPRPRGGRAGVGPRPTHGAAGDFTMWYGVYQSSTRTLSYANAGAPPAIALSSSTRGRVTATKLSVSSVAVGLFEDTQFTTATFLVPNGLQILLYSDGASEIVLPNGEQLSPGGVEKLAIHLGGSTAWSLDDLIAQLLDLTPRGSFDDDCSLMQLTFE